jgi:hypothetical protein
LGQSRDLLECSPPPGPFLWQGLLRLDHPDLGAVLLDPGRFPECPQVKLGHLDGADNRVQIRRPTAVASDDIAGQLERPGAGGLQCGELAFDLGRVKDHRGHADL